MAKNFGYHPVSLSSKGIYKEAPFFDAHVYMNLVTYCTLFFSANVNDYKKNSFGFVYSKWQNEQLIEEYTLTRLMMLLFDTSSKSERLQWNLCNI